MAAKKGAMATRVENLRIVLEHDPDSKPEMSGDPEYEREDQARIDAWKRDEWFYVGIYVECDLIVSGTVQSIRTPGLWGIEDDSGEKYIQEVAEQEYDELLGILKQLGISKRQVPPLDSAEKIERV